MGLSNLHLTNLIRGRDKVKSQDLFRIYLTIVVRLEDGVKPTYT